MSDIYAVYFNSRAITPERLSAWLKLKSHSGQSFFVLDKKHRKFYKVIASWHSEGPNQLKLVILNTWDEPTDSLLLLNINEYKESWLAAEELCA